MLNMYASYRRWYGLITKEQLVTSLIWQSYNDDTPTLFARWQPNQVVGGQERGKGRMELYGSLTIVDVCKQYWKQNINPLTTIPYITHLCLYFCYYRIQRKYLFAVLKCKPLFIKGLKANIKCIH